VLWTDCLCSPKICMLKCSVWEMIGFR
jgi:hypothetical protein